MEHALLAGYLSFIPSRLPIQESRGVGTRQIAHPLCTKPKMSAAVAAQVECKITGTHGLDCTSLPCRRDASGPPRRGCVWSFPLVAPMKLQHAARARMQECHGVF